MNQYVQKPLITIHNIFYCTRYVYKFVIMRISFCAHNFEYSCLMYMIYEYIILLWFSICQVGKIISFLCYIILHDQYFFCKMQHFKNRSKTTYICNHVMFKNSRIIFKSEIRKEKKCYQFLFPYRG